MNETSLREAGRLIGRGREQVRKFVSGAIHTPHDRTREAIAILYLQRQKTGHVAETRVAAPSPAPLKLILPQGLERATAEIRAVFEPLRGNPDAPAVTAALETWLVRRVREEYAAEVPYPVLRQRRPRQKKDPR
ncbi:MAG TPA: hypothetical protein VFQ39_02810 [Longimicrobium sp.]|nr:hypothetical protein [Longimicrobium sp.]